jgi:hypothetical protein
MSVQTLVQIRRGTTSEWISANPTLSAGEWGLDTTTKRFKIGDGLTSWNSLPYSSILPNSNDLVGTSGIGIDFASTTGIPVTLSVTGVYASQVVDFNASVDARITAASISQEQVQDIIASGDHVTTGFLRNGTGIVIDYNDAADFVSINVSGYSLLGHTHDDRYYTETELNTNGAGGQVHYENITNLPTGFTPVSHTHLLAQGATDVNATASEVNYLDLTTGPGTAEASKAIVLDSNKDITGIGSITTTGSVTVGGNLVIQGSTTTVNSTTVDIGDNIIQVNVSGVETQGGLQVYDHDNTETHKLVWDITSSRWQFIGDTSPDVYTSGNISAGIFTSTIADGTAPLSVTSTTVVANLNADKLDGQEGYHYLDWTNATNKPDPIISGVLTGDVTGSGSATLTDLANGTITINTVLGANVVGSGNIIDGSIINADINANADIAVTKLAAGSAGQVLQVNSGGTIVWGSIDGGTP